MTTEQAKDLEQKMRSFASAVLQGKHPIYIDRQATPEQTLVLPEILKLLFPGSVG
jgi:hypothetical protein